MKLFANTYGDRRQTDSNRISAGAGMVSMERFSDRQSDGTPLKDSAKRSASSRMYKSGTHQIATMTFNNQDTVLMRAETDIHVCFLHDNRIYIFKKIPSAGDESNFIVKNPNSPFDDIEEASSEMPHVESLMRELILHLVTSPKYR